MKLLPAMLLGGGLIAAPNPQSGANYYGQSWVGLLVSASCNGGAKNEVANQESDRTTTDRITTPAVDTPGTRGSSETTEPPPAAKGDVPQTGDISIRESQKIKDPGWNEARRQALSLNSACRVDVNTRQFALLLPEGKRLRFDDLGNSKIAAELKSRGMTAKPKILRVQVTGKLDSGAIAIDQIQM